MIAIDQMVVYILNMIIVDQMVVYIKYDHHISDGRMY